MVWDTTDTVPTATATPPTPDTATTMERGPLMPSPRLMLRPDTTVDTTDTVPTAMVWDTTDTVPTATATPPTPDTATTTARGPLMLSPSSSLPHTLMALTAMPHLSAPLLPLATPLSPPPLPPTASTSSTSVMPRPSLRLMLRLTTTVDTPATLMATVPTAMALTVMDTVPMATHTPMAVTTTKLLLDLYP